MDESIGDGRIRDKRENKQTCIKESNTQYTHNYNQQSITGSMAVRMRIRIRISRYM